MGHFVVHSNWPICAALVGHLVGHLVVHVGCQPIFRSISSPVGPGFPPCGLTYTDKRNEIAYGRKCNTCVIRNGENNYRINEAKKILVNEPDKTVLYVGLEVGFKSKSAFHINFTKIAGLTPTQYRQEAGIG